MGSRLAKQRPGQRVEVLLGLWRVNVARSAVERV
jgi:hypothetical protein